MRGTSGAGKSTVGRLAAERLGVPFVELDALRHGPGWVETPDDLFRDAVAGVVQRDAWVIDGNYAVVRDLVLERATAVVWLDLPRWLVMTQVCYRSVTRAALRRELWNGNREQVRTWVQPEHPMRWAWATHARRRAEYERMMDERWVRLRSRREITAWLDSLDGRRTPSEL